MPANKYLADVRISFELREDNPHQATTAAQLLRAIMDDHPEVLAWSFICDLCDYESGTFEEATCANCGAASCGARGPFEPTKGRSLLGIDPRENS